MRHGHGVRSVLLSILVLCAAAAPLAAQQSSVVLRSQTTIMWWVVDAETGRAAFFGGDIVALCDQDPEGYDLLEFQEVEQPNDVATQLVAHGDGIGTTLWEKAPTFSWPTALCRDVRAAEPLAVGESDLTFSGRFPTKWADPEVTAPYGLTAQGTLRTPEGEELRLNARYRCVFRGGETRCTQGLTVR